MKLITIVLPRLKTEFEYPYPVVKRVGFTRLWAQGDKTPPRFLDIILFRAREQNHTQLRVPGEIKSRQVELDP